jgi:hypothetical protein
MSHATHLLSGGQYLLSEKKRGNDKIFLTPGLSGAYRVTSTSLSPMVGKDWTMSAKWTKRELAYLRKHYKNTPNGTLADVLDLSKDAVRKKACRMGLRKSKKYLKENRLAGPARPKPKSQTL